MNIVSATITGSLILNGVNISSITGSESSINALNLFTASAATTGSNQFNGNQTVTGSVNITGSLIVTGSIIGTVTTASYVLNAVSASYALVATTSSYALVATSASYALNATTSSFALASTSASYALASTSASYALVASTASYADTFTVAGTLTAQKLVVQTITSSILYSSGSNIFGNLLSNTQSMTGSVSITGSLSVNGTTSTVGTGTANYVPKFTAISTIGNSAITDDGTTVTLVSRALSGTSATFSGVITSTITADGILSALTASTSRKFITIGNNGVTLNLGIENSAGGDLATGTSAYASVIASVGVTRDLQLATNNTVRLTLASTGAATFSSTIAASGRISTSHSTSGDYAAVFYNSSATGEGVTVRGGSTASHNAFIVQPYNGATTLFNILATGAATFSSSVTAGSSGQVFLTGNAGTSSIGMRFTNTGGNSFIGLSNSGGTGYLSGTAYAFNVQTEGAQDLQFGTNNTNRLIIASTGEATFSSNLTLGSGATLYMTAGDIQFVSNAGYGILTADSNRLISIQNGAFGVNGAATFTAAVTPLILKSTSATTMYTEYYYNTSTLSGYIGSGSGLLTGANNSDFIIRSEADFVVATGGNNRRLTIASTGEATFSGAAGITNGNGLNLRAGGNSASDANVLNFTSLAGTINVSMFSDALNSNTRLKSLGNLSFHTGNIAISADNERVTILSTGNVGIGTTSPSYQLQLSTDSAAKPSTNTWTISSDSRLKENITPYTKGLSAIMAINPVNYDYNGKAGFSAIKNNIGVIAQDVLEILPESISTYKAKLEENDAEDTELYNFNSHALTYILINAIKELKAEIDLLKGKPIIPTDNNLE
jgi:hypothetical protein